MVVLSGGIQRMAIGDLSGSNMPSCRLVKVVWLATVHRSSGSQKGAGSCDRRRHERPDYGAACRLRRRNGERAASREGGSSSGGGEQRRRWRRASAGRVAASEELRLPWDKSEMHYDCDIAPIGYIALLVIVTHIIEALQFCVPARFTNKDELLQMVQTVTQPLSSVEAPAAHGV